MTPQFKKILGKHPQWGIAPGGRKSPSQRKQEVQFCHRHNCTFLIHIEGTDERRS